MRRVPLVLFVLAACGSDDMTPPTGPDGCPSVTAAIAFPLEGATDVPRMLDTRVIWSDPGAEHWRTLTDENGNNYTPIDEDILSDGTIISHWGPVPANTTFTFDVGWWCISFERNCAPLAISLGTISFTTGAN